MKVLIAEDDANTRAGLEEILRDEGYETIGAADGAEAIRRFLDESPDFVCLDIMMPEVSGYDVCRRIRRTNTEVPVIFISAKSEEIDRVLGLELGADDYIMKPFGVREVLARIRAVTRRALAAKPGAAVADTDTSAFPEMFRMDDLEVRPAELRAHRGAKVVELSLRDVKILWLLFRHRGEVVTRDMLFNEAWGLDHIPQSRSLDQHISQLRKRIEREPKRPRIVHTVHGAGYRHEL